MTRQTVNTVIKEFGASFGAPDMMLDDNDFLCVQAGEGLLINVDYFESDDCLVLYTTLGEIFDETRLELYEELLKANFFWDLTGGATLSINPDGDLALLTASVMAENLDVNGLTNVFQHVTQLSFAWSARIREITANSLGARNGTVRAGKDVRRPDPAQLA